MRTTWLVLKQHRFDVIVLGWALIVVALGITFVAVRLSALPTEIAGCPDPVTCKVLQDEFDRLQGITNLLLLAGAGLPILAGLLLGVPLVAREVERGTASLPWTMSRSRSGWFLRRVAILGGTILVITILPAIALEVLMQAVRPDADTLRSFELNDVRGPVVSARALTTFGVAALSGALLGRALPAVLMTIGAIGALFLGLQILDDSWLHGEAVPLDTGRPIEAFDYPMDALVVGVGYILPDGRVVDWETAYGTIDPNRSPEEFYEQVWLGVPAALAPEKRAREIGVILLAGIACIGAATFVVGRRRPY